MANKFTKDKRESGGFVAMPYTVLRSSNYANLSSHAVKLLNDFLSQYNGKNNGDLCCAWSLMIRRGWKSKSTLSNARKELIGNGWIELTRQGGRHRASLYAVTFYAIDECNGKLDVQPTRQPRSTWKTKNAGTGSVLIDRELVREAYH